MSQASTGISTRPRRPRSGKKDPYTPHPGLRARVRRARVFTPPPAGRPTARAGRGHGARPPLLNQEWKPSTDEDLRGQINGSGDRQPS
ncbi:hypothetical protein FFZ77_07570 [Streptomyces katsurahamanus]|uniref:Uncharacterized protein n=2 Tax=Streptomyces TaxID=1883 RepID=A0A646KUG9_STRJU|nr:hypothetical protein [Streptomyces katsurahamanus]MQT04646.1 hypothetical protein [Streptomyces jumonjinensis]